MNSQLNIETLCSTFREISTSVHSYSSERKVLELLVKKTTEVLGAKGAIIRILNLDTHQLELSAFYGLSEKYLSKGHVSSEKKITDLCRQDKVIIIDDVLSDPRVQYPKEAKEEGIQMMIDLPLTIQDHVVGIIRIFFDRKRTFTEEELNFVVFIAEQSSSAIDKARLLETHRLQYHQLALQTEKLSALGRMAAGIAHEINNPLTGILLFSSNLIKKVPRKGPLKEGLETIIHETIRCRQIIQELLEFSRDKEPAKTLSNLNDIILKALNILENEFRLQHVRIEKQLSGSLPDIFLDANQMQQVFINLIINALEAIQTEGVITIQSRLDPEAKTEIVIITDSGCGIPADQINKAFEPFFSTKPKGTGLGLAVSYGIVRNHQGNITVSSQVGRGTRFTIQIPILQEISPREKEA